MPIGVIRAAVGVPGLVDEPNTQDTDFRLEGAPKVAWVSDRRIAERIHTPLTGALAAMPSGARGNSPRVVEPRRLRR